MNNVTSYKVDMKGPDKITLSERDKVKSILQNLAILLSTRQGSVPLYRDFGLPMRFIDKPVTIAKTIMVAEITEAIQRFEPRASYKDISFRIDEGKSGKLAATVEVEISS